MTWCTVIGNWGDAIACYGNIRKLAEEEGLDKVDIIYYGLNPQVAGFVAQQEGIGRFVVSQPPDMQTYAQVIRYACETPDVSLDRWFGFLGADKIISHDNLRITHVNAERHQSTKVNRYPMKVRDEVYQKWCQVVIDKFVDKAVLLVQPYSLDNASIPLHWKHWIDAVDWLDKCGVRMVLAGKDNFLSQYEGGRNTLNLIGKTESMEDVFALAEVCQGVLTTSNALSMYTVANKIWSMVMQNAVIEKSKYFTSWIALPPNQRYSVNVDFSHFKTDFERYWDRQRLNYYEKEDL